MNRKHISIYIFFILVFVLSIPFWILGFVQPVQLLPGLPISSLGVFAPTLAAFILTWIQDGFTSALHLFQRAFDFKRIKNKWWYLAVILINPAITVVTFMIMRLAGESLPNPALLSASIIPLFAVFFIAALGEEIGWTGYATAPLQQRLGSIPTGILLGSIWAIWHFIPLIQVQRSAEWIAWWSLGTISLRMIMVWLFNHTNQSVFSAALFHAMINLCWQLFPYNGSYFDPRVFGLVSFSFAVVIYLTQLRASHSKKTSNSVSIPGHEMGGD